MLQMSADDRSTFQTKKNGNFLRWFEMKKKIPQLLKVTFRYQNFVYFFIKNTMFVLPKFFGF